MRKKWLITVLLGFLIMGVGAWVLSWPRTVPFSQCSEIYQKYAGNPGIDASFVKNFRINDTVFVDVTLLKAVDTNGWNLLCKDLQIPKLDSLPQSLIDSGLDLIFTRRFNGYDYSQPVTDTSTNVVLRAVSYLKQKVSVFHIKNEAESHAVYLYNFDKSIKQTKTQL